MGGKLIDVIVLEKFDQKIIPQHEEEFRDRFPDEWLNDDSEYWKNPAYIPYTEEDVLVINNDYKYPSMLGAKWIYNHGGKLNYWKQCSTKKVELEKFKVPTIKEERTEIIIDDNFGHHILYKIHTNCPTNILLNGFKHGIYPMFFEMNGELLDSELYPVLNRYTGNTEATLTLEDGGYIPSIINPNNIVNDIIPFYIEIDNMQIIHISDEFREFLKLPKPIISE